LTSLLFLKKMKKYFIVIAVLTGIGLMVSSFINFPGKEKKIRFIRNDAEKKVDVLVDDHLFTSYIYPDNIKKPVLYPLTTPMGTRITRRFPLEHSVGERTDHPHHVGLWFNYGDVNGLDFWNNSDSIKPDKRSGYGTIVHQKIVSMQDGKLEVLMQWVSPEGKILLLENTTFIFKATDKEYSIDRITRLTAANGDVSFKDNKEGVLGIRVCRELELPDDKPQIFTDSKGVATTVKVLNNEGVHGQYLNSNGVEGLDCWGKRANWMVLTSNIGREDISLAILDHPQNVGYPTYWHARGYGLFAANPLGQEALSDGKDKLNFALKNGESVTFKHRILIANQTLNKSDLDSKFSTFSKM